MSLIKLFCAAALLATAGAHAANAVHYNATTGLDSTVSGHTTITFDSGLPTAGPISYTGTVFAYPGNSGYAALPPGDTSAFYSVGADHGQIPVGTATVAGNGLSYFGFFMGSPDSYNTVTFYHGNDVVATLSGDDMARAGGVASNGDQSHGFYMNVWSDGPSFTKITFSSVQNGTPVNAFETDNHAYIAAVPEPETYAMLLAGIGLLGWMRRRKA